MQYNVNAACMELSVRELCARAYSAGDLEYGGGQVLYRRMQEGGELHRRIQAGKGPGYASEVPLTNTTLYEGMCYCVSGRADGIEGEGDETVVEEIKTFSPRGFAFPTPRVYLAQLRVYGWFVCAARKLDRIRLRLLRVNAETEETEEEEEVAEAGKLRGFYEELLGKIHWFAEIRRDHTLVELPGLADLPFPYTGMRAGQETLVRTVYRKISRGGELFVQAPTGIGKTVSVLYPAVRGLGNGKRQRVFYLTAKASTRQEAFGAARRLCGCGGKFRTVVLTAREQCCANADAVGAERRLSAHCNGVECEYAAGYYDRVGDALRELLSGGWGYDRTALDEVAKKYKICPYEFSLDVSEYCDVIIGDYNYVFDPLVYLRRYFAPGVPEAETEGNVFLVDEAHNLLDRARDMYSVGLRSRSFERLYAKADRRDKALNEGIETLLQGFYKLKKLCKDTLTVDANGRETGYFLSPTPLCGFNERLSWFSAVCKDWLRLHGQEDIAPLVQDIWWQIKEYTCILEHYDEHYATYVEVGSHAPPRGGEEKTPATPEIRVRLLCLDPSGELRRLLHRAGTAVLFSATLTPLDYFKDVLGGEKNAETLALPSPFDQKRFGLFALRGVSTRYETRGEFIPDVAVAIGAAVSGKRGNYIVYFPSYAYLEAVLREFKSRYPAVTTVVQKRGMRQEEKETFLDAFPGDKGVLRVGFCVLGGSFSEGVDLPGSRLIGCVVVGVGLPGLSNERNILQEYYQNKSENGREYAYIYPGMNRVLQAAGRVIRREEDTGIVVLIDDRYAEPPYPALCPPHWNHLHFAGSVKNLAECVKTFWQEREERENNVPK